MKIINERAFDAYEYLINGFDAEKIRRGFDHESNRQFVRGAISLASQKLANPFPAGSEAAHLFFKMHYCYGLWRRGGIDHKVSYIRMLRAAAELAAMNLENPYDYFEPEVDAVSLEDLAEQEVMKSLAEDIASETFVPAIDVTKVFGVLPEKEDE